jgi:hypothetical protein
MVKGCSSLHRSKEVEKEEEGEGQGIVQDHAPSVLLLLARPSLLKFLPIPK